ncbi:MAG: DNA polymerase III subunit gamma/tau [Pseudoramibacter sp.]
MAYMALYRKYRPQSFDEVVGQQVTVKILKNQITSGRIGHAYLFAGIRGTGKTTIAKIFARAINCPNNQDGNPCNVCKTCREIEQPGVMDIIEIDAASNRGVDEIRDIREKVKYPPTLGRYKVYIIDEVHMLTREAFNALLKTLEEPPAHVVFILATTEPNKLPMTILSRCQRFDIRPIAQQAIVDRMKAILNDIGIGVEEEALQFIATRGDHSMRDALSILDQVIDLREDGKTITYAQVLDFLGMADRPTILRLAGDVIGQDAAAALTVLQELKSRGRDATLILDQLIDMFRQILIVQSTGAAAKEILGIGDGDLADLGAAAEGASSSRLFGMMDILIGAKEKLKYNDMAEVVLEMTVLKLASAADIAEGQTVQPAPASDPKRRPRVQKSAPVQSKTAPQSKAAPAPQPAEMTETPETAPQPAAEAEAPEKADAPISAPALQKKMLRFLEKKAPLDGKMFEKGKLIQKGPGHYALCFFDDGANRMAFDRCSRSEAKLEGLARKLSGQDVHLKVKSVKKNFDDMNFTEKTAAIIGKTPIVQK